MLTTEINGHLFGSLYCRTGVMKASAVFEFSKKLCNAAVFSLFYLMQLTRMIYLMSNVSSDI